MDRRPNRDDRIEQMALWLEAIELAIEAVQAEQQPDRRQRSWGVIARAVEDARRERENLEQLRQRPGLCLLAGGAAGGYRAAEPIRVTALRRPPFRLAAAISPSHAG